MEEVDVGVIWMSAGNSYFKEEVIERILRKASKKFPKLIVMAPDKPAQHTYKAMGYPENKARRKAILNANLLQNRARRVVEKLKKEGIKTEFEIVEWIDEIVPDKRYQKKYKEILGVFNSNKEFKRDALKTTENVLKTKSKAFSRNALNEAVHYLLKEIAFVASSPKIYNAKSITYIYHKDWKIYRKFISGGYDGLPRPKLKFMIID